MSERRAEQAAAAGASLLWELMGMVGGSHSPSSFPSLEVGLGGMKSVAGGSVDSNSSFLLAEGGDDERSGTRWRLAAANRRLKGAASSSEGGCIANRPNQSKGPNNQNTSWSLSANAPQSIKQTINTTTQGTRLLRDGVFPAAGGGASSRRPQHMEPVWMARGHKTKPRLSLGRGRFLKRRADAA